MTERARAPRNPRSRGKSVERMILERGVRVSLRRLMCGGATQVHGRANEDTALSHLCQQDPLIDIRKGGTVGGNLMPVGGLVPTVHLVLGKGGVGEAGSVTPWLWRVALLHEYRGLKVLASMA